MDKNIQDLAWACLPKEARDEIRKEYSLPNTNDWEHGRACTYVKIFGKHNLTSGTEPAELLFVERDKVVDLYATMDKAFPREAAYSVQKALESLFNDKCLPDKFQDTGFGGMSLTPPVCKLDVKSDTPNTPNLGELKPQSVEGQPKFPIGSIVRITNKKNPYHGHKGRFGKVISYNAKFNRYAIAGIPSEWEEGDLEPYVEPKFKIGDIVEIIDGDRTLIEEIHPCNGEILYKVKGYEALINEKNLEPYTGPETKDNMEEKELNLCELLKGCEGEDFYSLVDGDVKLKEINDKYVTCQYHFYHLRGHLFGCSLDGVCQLYPSRALYEKYPLDAKKAWNEWASERKPKFILQAEIRLISNDGKTIEDYENVEVEVSDVDLTQAAEAVRETLMKFHETHSEK